VGEGERDALDVRGARDAVEADHAGSFM